MGITVDDLRRVSIAINRTVEVFGGARKAAAPRDVTAVESELNARCDELEALVIEQAEEIAELRALLEPDTTAAPLWYKDGIGRSALLAPGIELGVYDGIDGLMWWQILKLPEFVTEFVRVGEATAGLATMRDAQMAGLRAAVSLGQGLVAAASAALREMEVCDE